MMSGNEGEQPRRLLQEELTRFKRRRGAQISKGGGARSPFPVTVRFVVETPRTFAYYDVEAIGVEVAIDESSSWWVVLGLLEDEINFGMGHLVRELCQGGRLFD